jgi:putative ABC transport system permease protein
MAIPVSYNLLSAKERWTSSVVAVLGIAGTVGVFVAMLALARGFKATLVSSGQPANAIVQRVGADTEMTSAISIDEVRVAEEAPQIARDAKGPLVSPEVVVIAAVPMRDSPDGEANVQIRGVGPRALAVRDQVRIVEGRFLTPGLAEVVVGRGARNAYQGLDLGATVRLGAGTWTIVGVFDAGGSAFDSEVWADSTILNGFYQAATVKLRSPDDLAAFEATLKGDPRARLQAVAETAYYEKQSQVVTTLITVLGTLVAAVMALGAVFGALNTMYAAVTNRTAEIGTLRALGFSRGAILLSFLSESLLLALGGFVAGIAIGVAAMWAVNTLLQGVAFSMMTFSVATVLLQPSAGGLVLGLAFALAIGVFGGLAPAWRASRLRVVDALHRA